MLIRNAAPGLRETSIRKGDEITKIKFEPGKITPVSDEAWEKIKGRPVVRGWLAAGDLVMISSSDANAHVEAAAPHPLDHDGDGRPGGSKPKGKGGKGKKSDDAAAEASSDEASA